jgi:hypothetical protein
MPSGNRNRKSSGSSNTTQQPLLPASTVKSSKVPSVNPSPSPSESASSFTNVDLSDQGEFIRAVQEVDGFVFHLTKPEFFFLLLGMVAFVAVSILVAIAAEISISIHYFDKSPPPFFAELDAREQEINSFRKQRVTMPLPDLVVANRGHHHTERMRLERVIHMSPSGHFQAMLVVEESFLENASNLPLEQSASRRAQTKPPQIDYFALATVKPNLCADHQTLGYDNWDVLKSAVHEVNTISVESFVRWSRYFADHEDFAGTFNDDALYYEEENVLTICPGITLSSKKGGPIFINAPNLIVECDECTIQGGPSHFSFGPHAKNVKIRGLRFKQASASSLTFHHNGAHVTFEDCSWFENTNGWFANGMVADVNSSSNVHFYRCLAGRNHRGETTALASALSFRV